MMGRLGLRARLTVLVTAVFAAALTTTAFVVVQAVERRLIDDTRANAEAVLADYLDSIYGGFATVGVVGADATAQFFYVDEDGDDMTAREYFERILPSFDADAPTFPGATLEIVDLGATAIPALPIEEPNFTIDAESGVLLGPDGVSVTFVAEPVPVGTPQPIDRGDSVVAVTQTLSFDDGVLLGVGVSAPLQPVTDSLDTIVVVLWVAVPLLVLAVALITWLAASRALRPVQAIAEQADAISSVNLDQRVPVHAANDEIRRLATTVNRMLARLQSTQLRQRQLVADAAHELRSPVAASRAQLEVAAADPVGADWSTTSTTVLAEQERLTELIDDLLSLAVLDETGPGAMSDIDLDDLVASEAARQPVSVEVNVPQPVRVLGNPRLVTRSVRNLLDNAVRHADRRVAVTLRCEHGAATIHVDDDGDGVPEAERRHVFERFTRVEESRDRWSGGTGLGLAIARDVAVAHGGDVTCGDAPLGGARFTLTLPIDRR